MKTVNKKEIMMLVDNNQRGNMFLEKISRGKYKFHWYKYNASIERIIFYGFCYFFDVTFLEGNNITIEGRKYI